MRLKDGGAQLIGAGPAMMLRVLALFGHGIAAETFLFILDLPLIRAKRDIDALVDSGLILRTDEDTLTVNRQSAYWPGLVDLLDVRSRLVGHMLDAAQALAGPGTRVLLYGTQAKEHDGYDTTVGLYFLRPTDETPTWTTAQEFVDLFRSVGASSVLNTPLSDAEVVRALKGDPESIRDWVHADDLEEIHHAETGGDPAMYRFHLELTLDRESQSTAGREQSTRRDDE